MFQRSDNPNIVTAAFGIADLVYHSTVRSIRSSHGNAVIALLMNLVRAAILVCVFMILYLVIGRAAGAIRGDPLLFIMTGVFIFRTHLQVVMAVSGADSAVSGMMQHEPMSTAVSIASEALSTLYTQVLTIMIALFLYHSIWMPLEIYQPIRVLLMLILSWGFGVALGILLFALRPWAPYFVSMFTRLYRRINMVTSGKMFVANAIPSNILFFFEWNPLFHIIDQARGFAFVNYFPRVTSIEYPIYVMLGLLMLGLMWEFFTRKHVSASWSARQ